MSVAAAMVVALSFDASARQALDRTKMPAPGKTPDLRVPAWTKTTLANGADLIVSEKHDLPLVSFSDHVPRRRESVRAGGADRAREHHGRDDERGHEDAGTARRSRTRCSCSARRCRRRVGGESGSISFVSTTGKFDQTLDILADMLLNSTFPADALERLRAQRLVALTQARAQPGAIAGRVFPRVLYGRRIPTAA